MRFRLRYPFYGCQNGVSSGTQIMLKFLNVAAAHLSDSLVKSLKMVVPVLFPVENVRVLPGLQPLLGVRV